MRILIANDDGTITGEFNSAVELESAQDEFPGDDHATHQEIAADALANDVARYIRSHKQEMS